MKREGRGARGSPQPAASRGVRGGEGEGGAEKEAPARRREGPSARNRLASAPPAGDKAPRQGCGRPPAAGGGSPFPIPPSWFTPPGSPPLGPVAVRGSGRARGEAENWDSFPWRKHRAAGSNHAAGSAAHAGLREGAGGSRQGKGRCLKWRSKHSRSARKRCLFVNYL